MNRRFMTTLAALLLTLALLAGCSGTKAPEAPKTPAATEQKADPQTQAPASRQTTYPITIKDAAGRDVTLTAEPKRIVSVAPSNTELVFALGKGGSLAGRSDFCNYPAEVKSIPSVGGFMPPNYEAIVAAKPDLLLLTSGNVQEREKLINEYKINVLVIHPETFEDAYKQIALLGVALNAQDAATKVVADLQAGVKAVTDKVATAAAKPKVYYEVWDEPLMTAGAGTYIDDMIRLAGGVNVGADVKGWAMYSAEKVAAANPDIIIASSADIFGKIKARKGWESFSAIKNNKVVEVADADVVARPGPRLLEGLNFFAKTIHPELFK